MNIHAEELGVYDTTRKSMHIVAVLGVCAYSGGGGSPFEFRPRQYKSRTEGGLFMAPELNVNA